MQMTTNGTVRITALLENTTRRSDLIAEHGLSLLIETGGLCILFDMGQSDAFCHNAERLGVDLAAVDLAVLSHGHYDHGGGLSHFFKRNRTAPVYLRRSALLPHYNGTEKYIGLDPALAGHPRLRWVEDRLEPAPGVTLRSCQECKRRYPQIPSGLTERIGERFVPEDFRHEQYLLLESAAGRIVISGCSHRGVLDILSWLHPDVLIGGFHFSRLPLDGSLLEMAAVLEESGTEFYTCHCTGEAQYAFLRERMSRLSYLSCGDRILL